MLGGLSTSVVLGLFFILGSCLSLYDGLCGVYSFFYFDVVRFYLCFLTLCLFFVRCFFWGLLSYRSLGFVFLSVLRALLCYCCHHVILFWVFYELSILPLLYLLVRESPYSERFLAA